MQRLNNKTDDSFGAFRSLNGRFPNSHPKVNPPERFITLQSICGLKDLHTDIKQTNQTITESNNNENETSYTVPAKKLAGRYKVLQLIGQGQSSIIVAAEDLYHYTKKAVAIKIMNLDYTSLGIQEADCILQLNRADPLNVSRVARLLNKFTFQNHFCMVFELLRPRPLHQYFQDSCFDSEAEKLEKIREVAVQVLGVLGFLRRENVIHADLKPENILLESGRRLKVKVVDFGNAIRWIHHEMSLYYDNFELQTLLYRAPEVIFGVPFGPEVDMWSLGCILAELCLGKPLFWGTTKSEVLQDIVTTLGPLPRIPFQSGKFYSEFANFMTSKAGVSSLSTEMKLMKKLSNTRNFTFANFLAGLLHYNPNQRLTPAQAIRHPFLVEQVPFGGFFSNTADEMSGSVGDDPSRSGILLTSSQYTHRPHVDDDIRRQQLSSIELLHAGTRGKSSPPRQPVGRVVPLVTESTSNAPDVLSAERKRVSLPPEGSSSKKRMKLSTEVKGQMKINVQNTRFESQHGSHKARRSLKLIEESKPKNANQPMDDDILLL